MSIAVAIVLFDGGLDLVRRDVVAEERGVVRRLRDLGIPITWAGAGLLAGLLLGLSFQASVMLGAILIVSGPTVVTPITAGRTGSALRATSLSKRSEVADAGDDEGHEVVGGDP